ncbi:DUF6520 family protein [Chryseobacterium sp. MDT2-18]|uniref:DUF6520 family protein n=1 Tax=Chryseobacterium sp. MDT2-18 TaxID=1259136 RepID=UPI00277D6043|nr:DUF6520 family protein [Chryseobacterium sp. MDT2-18]MDQ0477089.1 hypothetical protein [Chryseobacterium sp. MDT2-18]
MKNVKSFLIPVALVFLGAGSAFATHKAKASEKVGEIGFYYDASAPAEQCIEYKEVDCNKVSGPVCTEIVSGVSRTMLEPLNNTECGVALHRN